MNNRQWIYVSFSELIVLCMHIRKIISSVIWCFHPSKYIYLTFHVIVIIHRTSMRILFTKYIYYFKSSAEKQTDESHFFS